MNITQLKQGSLNGLRKQTNECLDAAYSKGFEDGKKENKAIFSEKEIKNIANKERQEGYNIGYNTAINDYNAMIQFLHDCTDDFKEFMNKKYGYDIMYLTNSKLDEGAMLYDLIFDHDIAEVISEFKIWQEEKNEIKVGDEVVVTAVGFKGIVLSIYSDEKYRVIYKDGIISNEEKNTLKRTGRHFDELQQLLDKMKE